MSEKDPEIFDQWLKDSFPVKIELGWEVLPALDGSLHCVDPDPDSYQWAELLEPNPHYSVSLCGKVLLAKDGKVELADVCPVCLELSKERQAEFDAERGAAS